VKKGLPPRYKVDPECYGLAILENQLISAGDLKLLFSLDQRQFDLMRNEGYLTAQAKGVYDFREAIEGVVRFLESTKGDAEIEEGDPRLSSYEAERTRKMAWDAKLSELNFKERKGELISREEEYSRATKVMVLVRSRLLNIPARVTPRVLGRDDARAVEEEIRIEIVEGLEELAHPDALVGKDFRLDYEVAAEDDAGDPLDDEDLDSIENGPTDEQGAL
jgi:hypothetical protein